MNRIFKYSTRLFVALGAGLMIGPAAFAQDSLKQATIELISTYQPKLRDAAKLNLTASLPAADTSRARMTYDIPALNLNFMYQPVPLRPLALGKDSVNALQNNFVKVGFGNLKTPLVQAGIGSGRNDQYNFGLFVNYIGSKGNIEYQDYNNVNVLASGTYYSPLFEIDGKVAYNRNQVHYYGYDHALYDYSKADVKQTFNEFIGKIGLKNRPTNEWGFIFKPAAEFIYFNDAFDRNERTFTLKALLRKQIFEDIYLQAEGIADLSTFKEKDLESINNNVVSIHPALEIAKPGFFLHAGANPTWTNGYDNTGFVKSKFYLLPDIVNETHLVKKKLILSSGWISYFEKNNFRNLTQKNPFIDSYPGEPANTRIEERYTGIKGTIGGHFNYNTKFSSIVYENMALFVNNDTDGKTFNVRNETEMKAFQVHAEVGYIEEEKFQVRVSGDWFNYRKQATELKPWGLVPFMANLNAQVSVAKKLHLTGDLYGFSGSYYLVAPNDFAKTDGAFDLNLGANYDIGKNVNLWINANNLFNSEYQRWNGYKSYGFNIVGGIMLKF